MRTSDANKATYLRGILPDIGQHVPDQKADGHRGRQRAKQRAKALEADFILKPLTP